MKPIDPHAIVFRPTNRYITFSIVMGFFTGLFILATLAIIDSTDGSSVVWYAVGLFVLLWLGLAYIGWRMIVRVFLAISSDGVEFYSLGTHQYVKWKNIEDIQTQRTPTGDSWVQITGLAYTRTANELYKSKTKVKSKNQKATVLIPLEGFAPKKAWRNHQIGELIQQYAPRLLAD